MHRDLTRQLALALLALAALHACADPAFAGQVPSPINAASSTTNGDLATNTANPQQAGPDSGLSATAAGQNKVVAGPASGGAGALTERLLTGADLPNPSAATLGGVRSAAATSHQWINSISTSGVPAATQPASTDLSDEVSRTTFTPTVTFSTPGDLSVSYSVQTGAYAKVGPLVCFWEQIGFTPTFTTAAGTLEISEPPAAPTDPDWQIPVSLTSPAWTSGATQIEAVKNGSVLLVQGMKSAGANADFTTTQIVSGTAYTLKISACYF